MGGGLHYIHRLYLIEFVACIYLRDSCYAVVSRVLVVITTEQSEQQMQISLHMFIYGSRAGWKKWDFDKSIGHSWLRLSCKPT